ncbi:hypothetical protein [Methylobacterium haplocladii]|uniref:Radical SAM protein n=1 Tax=Methylobacterium haplocladii TaxID=1176176 RepID=A0A512ISA2_9HYPH|nr:hypothetical protein [Methylobacterium haplocladii]GEP00587.1 hypothetical protein MHA02_29740 [Methylobacterium haplocladii]GJD85502.1 hypothetical protein HPGCJGGD_3391 [Methylobacterium haplocladii]GLS57735.1 hypothetical protein GCM10007887_03910 [Methylobacterium haplocladii]
MSDFTRGSWAGGLAEWIDGDTVFLSVAFTWKLDDAYQRAIFWKAQGYRVRAGGPGIFTRKHYLADVAEIGGSAPDAVIRHNPMATVASRGCSVGCWFCIVPKMEGRTYTELPDFPVRPVLCDNNLSDLSREYQEHIVSRYRATGVPLLDANSGFEPRTFDDEVYRRWQPILRGPWRFGFDEATEGADVERAFRLLRDVSSRRKQVYTMIGHEPFAVCMERIRRVIAWGGEPYAQPFMKLNALEKRPHVRHDWTPRLLSDVARWVNRRGWKSGDFDTYRRSARNRHPAQADQLELAA